MQARLKEWFDTKGHRLAELKAFGGQEYMVVGFTKNLTDEELREFKILTIQMESVVWALSPKGVEAQDKYINQIKKYFSKIEEPFFKAKEFLKGRKLPRGYA